MANEGARARMGASLRALAPAKAPEPLKPSVDIVKINHPDKLETFYKFDEKLYDAGDRSKVFSAVELASGKNVIVKMRRKGFFSGGERVWRNVLTRIMNIERNDHVLGVDTILEDDKVGVFFQFFERDWFSIYNEEVDRIVFWIDVKKKQEFPCTLNPFLKNQTSLNTIPSSHVPHVR